MATNRTSLADVRSLPDPLLTYNWDIVIPSMPGVSDARSLTFKALSTSIPGSQIEEVRISLGPAEIIRAGREVNSHNWACTFHETRDVMTRHMLMNWKKIVRNNAANTGTYNSVHATTIQLVLYDDQPRAVRQINLIGAWPLNIDDTALDRASAAVAVSVTFAFDDFNEVPLN